MMLIQISRILLSQRMILAEFIISESVIYIVFGHSTDDGGYIETSGGLYNYNGELVYGF